MTKKSERIALLETKVARLEQSLYELRFPNTARFNRESPEVDAIMTDIKRKAKPTLDELLATYPTPDVYE